MEELGIGSIAARSPQAKGRIERLWGTLQDRLVAEFAPGGDHHPGNCQCLPAGLPGCPGPPAPARATWPTRWLWEAIEQGHTALIRPVHCLLADLHAARANGTFGRRFARLCSLGLVVLDDFGLWPLSPQAAEDRYELIRERYERRPLVISNRTFPEWAEAFGDPFLASAALDRLTHHCHTLTITGQSYGHCGRRKEAPNPMQTGS